MNRYFIDSGNIICLDGIRCAQKNDGKYSDGFSFSVTYKGNNFVCKYPDRFSRDAAFDKLCEEIEKRNKK